MTRLLISFTVTLAAFRTASAEHVTDEPTCMNRFRARLTAVQEMVQPMSEESARLQRWLASRDTTALCREVCLNAYHPRVARAITNLYQGVGAYYDIPDADAGKDAAIMSALRNDATYSDMENADACVAFAQRKAGSGWPAALSAYTRTKECLGFADDVSIDSASFKQHVLGQIQQHTTGGAKPLADTMKDVEHQVVSHFESACADAIDSELLRTYENDFFRSVLENSEVQKACHADMHLTSAATVDVSGVVGKLESQYDLLARLQFLDVFLGDAVAKELLAGKDNMVNFMLSWKKEMNSNECLQQTKNSEPYASLQKSMLEDCERRVRDHPVFSVMRKAEKDKQVAEMCTTGEHAYHADGIIHALSQTYAKQMEPLYASVALVKKSEKADEIIIGLDNEHIMTFCPIQDGEELDVDAVVESLKKDKRYTDKKDENAKVIEDIQKQVNDKAISEVLINNTYRLVQSKSGDSVQVITQYKDARDKVLEKITKQYRDDVIKTFAKDGGKKDGEVETALRDVISAEITKAAESADTLKVLQDANNLEEKTAESLKDSSTVQGLVKEKLSAKDPKKIQKLIVKKVMQTNAIKEALDKIPTDSKKAKTKALQEAVSKAVSEKFVDGEEPVEDLTEDPLKILYPGEELDKMLKTTLGEADEGDDEATRLKKCVDKVKAHEKVMEKVNGATVEEKVYEKACTEAANDHDDAVKKFLDTYKKPCDPLCTIIIVIACVAGGLIVLGLIYVMCYMFDDETDEVSEEYDEETEDQEEDHEGTVVSCP